MENPISYETFMKIGVVSDTHSLNLPRQMLEDFKKVDFIIHAGDFCSLEDLQKIAKVKEVKAVWGNMDDAALRKKLPRRQIIPCGKFKIGVFHGEGAPQTVLASVQKEFKGEKVDCIIFGHSHQPFNEEIKGVLYFNPGSPNDYVRPPYPSYGILEVGEKKIIGQLIKVRE